MRLARKLLYSKDTLKTEILGTPIRDIGLTLRGTMLQRCVERALEDTRQFGVELEPYFYLSDTYGCVEGTTNIGLGFWDADNLLREIVRETRDIFRDEGDLLMLIKHEIGHAFCYAYKLYRLKEFREIFQVEGHFFRSYPASDRYRWNPWSTDYVNPEGDFYAQKHPDEDFAETFATYVDPTEGWRERYNGREGVPRKIQFIRRAIRTYGRKKPYIATDTKNLHRPVEEIRLTVAEFFKINPRRYAAAADGYLDADLKALFKVPGRIQKPTLSSWQLLNRYRLFIEKTVVSQSRISDVMVVRELIGKTLTRLKALRLVYLEEEEEKALAQLTSFLLLKTISFKLFGRFKMPVR